MIPFAIKAILSAGLTILVLSLCLRWVRFVEAVKNGRRDQARSRMHQLPQTDFVSADAIGDDLIDRSDINQN